MAVSTQAERAVFCHRCGVKLEEGARFCTSCGTQVENINADGFGATPDEGTNAAPSATSTVGSSQAKTAKGIVDKTKRSAKARMARTALITALIIAALCGAAMAANYVYQKHFAPYRNATPITREDDQSIGGVIDKEKKKLEKQKKKLEKQVEEEAQKRFEEWLEEWLSYLILSSCSSTSPATK